MNFCWKYIAAAPIGGLLGGLGHGLVSDNAFGRKLDATERDFSGFRDLGVGFISGLVWLLPNQNLWVGTSMKASDVIRIALRTMIIGLAGSGWLTSYLNANALKGAVVKAADASPDPTIAHQINSAQSVSQIVSLVKRLSSIIRSCRYIKLGNEAVSGHPHYSKEPFRPEGVEKSISKF